MWKYLLILIILLTFIPSITEASTTADVVVTAQGFVGEAPGGLIITYVSDYKVDLSWTKGTNSTNTMIRVKYGDYPEDRNDGYLVYLGTDSNCTDPNVILASPEIPYYRAWSQSSEGAWEEVGTTAEANFMSMSFLFGILVILGLVLFIAAFRWKDMLLSYSAALTWMAIGFWWILGDITNFGLSDPWVKILVFIPFILAFTVLLRLMNTEIVSESKGRRWSEWGATPREEVPSRRDSYRKTLRERIR
jgi:hypothetical protein